MDRRNNAEFVTDLMTHSNYGGLAQMFVIDALAKWSTKIADTPIEKLREVFGKDAFIDADAWHGVATEIKHKIEARSA